MVIQVDIWVWISHAGAWCRASSDGKQSGSLKKRVGRIPVVSGTCTRQRRKRGAQSQSCGGTVLNSAVEVAARMQRSKVIRLLATPPLCMVHKKITLLCMSERKPVLQVVENGEAIVRRAD